MIKIILLSNNRNILFIGDLLCSHFRYLEKIKKQSKNPYRPDRCHTILKPQKAHAGHFKLAKGTLSKNILTISPTSLFLASYIHPNHLSHYRGSPVNIQLVYGERCVLVRQHGHLLFPAVIILIVNL